MITFAAGGVAPFAGLGGFAGFQRLVHLEEVVDFGLQESRDVVEVLQMVPAGITIRNGKHFGVGSSLVAHLKDTYRSCPDVAAGKDRLVHEHEHVERVAVTGKRLGDEAVVLWIASGSEQRAVEPDVAGLVVELVLVARILRDLNNDFDAVGVGRARLMSDGTHASTVAPPA